MNIRFSSKLLLFGEYAIIKGAKGLAIPFQEYSGALDFSDSVNDFKSEFLSFHQYLSNLDLIEQELNLDQFERDIENGIYFDSNIPKGAGVGSSGALCASIYKRYLKNEKLLEKEDLKFLLDRMALMESFYHGSSSGLDPLISLINRAVLVENRNKVTELNLNTDFLSDKFYLLNSNHSRKTAPLVHLFIEKTQDDAFKKNLEAFIEYNNSAIEAFLENDIDALTHSFYNISKWQYINMSEMIIDPLKEKWLEGLENKNFYLKLCGAGGGGHYIMYKNLNSYPTDFFNNSLRIF